MKLSAATGLLGALGISGCAFLLDFDELQGGPPEDAGTGGAAGSEGGCGSCDDGDLCTDDVCVEGVCRHYSKGVVDDGVAYEIDAPQVPRVTIAGNDSGFFGAALVVRGGLRDVETFAVPREGDAAVAGPKVSELTTFGGRRPLGAPGIVATRTLPNRVHAYVPVAAPSGENGEVWRVRLTTSLVVEEVTRASLLPSYAPDQAAFRHPLAWQVAGSVVGAWISGDGRARLDDRGVDRVIGEPGEQVTAIAPLVGPSEEPGVLYFTLAGRVRTQFGALPPVDVTPLCTSLPTPNVVTFADTAQSPVLPGTVIGAWTRLQLQGQAVVAAETESRLLSCGGLRCVGGPCDGTETSRATTGTAVETLTRQAEPNVLYLVSASARLLEPTFDRTALEVQVVRVDLESGDARLLLPGFGRELARAQNAEAPALPVLAVSGSDRVGVAWRADGQAGRDATARFERLRVCFPTVDDLTGPSP